MSIITIVEASFCNGNEVVKQVCEKGALNHLSEEQIIVRTAASSGMRDDKIKNALSAKTSIFNRFTHEKERAIAHLRLTLAEILREDQLLISGAASLLIPRRINHVLRVCLVADVAYRIKTATTSAALSEKQARQHIRKEEEDFHAWLQAINKGSDPWAPELYDILLPMDKTSVDDAVNLILQQAESDVVAKTGRTEAALDDFLLAARVGAKLAHEGHDVHVEAAKGAVTLTINKNVLMLSHLEEELVSIVSPMEGVTSVQTKVGESYYQPDIYRRYNFETPSKILLVDDERDFVQTLSERLLMRDMGSAIAYDGESALDMIKEDEPEVMILDLNMPGIDGIEVLRRVKQTNPDIEVIVLTGHGTEKDRETCMGLGAFAFLQKPVDIKLLSDTLMQANEKAKTRHSTP